MSFPIGTSQQINPLEDLIGASLNAIIKAQIIASNSSLQFLLDMGFEADKEEKMPKDRNRKTESLTKKLRMVEFSYNHPIPDPSNPGNVIDTPTVVKVPLLTLFSVPHIGISEADMNFNIKILGIQKIQSNNDDSKFRSPLSLNGVFASRQSTKEGVDEESNTCKFQLN